MYKIICCDLDDTLLSSDKSISLKNKEFIKKARNKGVKFVVCTGRVLSAVDNILEELELKNQEGEFLISLNGGAIYENNGKLLYADFLPKTVAEKVFQKGVDLDICLRIYTKDSFYGYNLDKDTKLKETYQNVQSALKEFFTPSLDFLNGEDLVKIVFIDDDKAKLKKIENELKDLEVELTFSSPRSLEINHKGVNKGSGLLWLSNYLGFSKEEVIAIGDNFNDESMIKTAGLGICVKNGDEEIKKIAKFISEKTNDEGAVAEIIEKFILQ